ncbi:fimbrial protein [Shigella sonnei]
MINTSRKQKSISQIMLWMGFLLSISLFISLPAKADVTVTVKVNVVEATCSVTGEHGDQAKIEFGDVSLDRVKSANVKKQTTLHITCEGDAPGGKTLNLTLKEPTGTMSYDGNQVLGTNVSHLGIGLTLGNSNTFQPLNAAIPVSAGDIELGGVLVTDKADELQAGSFSAAVSVVAAYM